MPQILLNLSNLSNVTNINKSTDKVRGQNMPQKITKANFELTNLKQKITQRSKNAQINNSRNKAQMAMIKPYTAMTNPYQSQKQSYSSIISSRRLQEVQMNPESMERSLDKYCRLNYLNAVNRKHDFRTMISERNTNQNSDLTSNQSALNSMQQTSPSSSYIKRKHSQYFEQFLINNPSFVQKLKLESLKHEFNGCYEDEKEEQETSRFQDSCNVSSDEGEKSNIKRTDDDLVYSKRMSYPENLSESSVIYMHAEDDSPYSPYDTTVRYSKKFRPSQAEKQRPNTCCGYRCQDQYDDYDVDFRDILIEQKVNLITNQFSFSLQDDSQGDHRDSSQYIKQQIHQQKSKPMLLQSQGLGQMPQSSFIIMESPAIRNNNHQSLLKRFMKCF
ncbi:UNKNOWN [Stylonychia lemnae]|uniref:Uncharacterized protein n=1 Tax=Stylonychia lemnae TaxID=5949 RepID=A0A078AJP6_STYLE|nr:UNKNOWN [Stylonychia lemnae]|eukprot:CDW82111.1 UNKNOWN [Stylonychia lemnae]